MKSWQLVLFMFIPVLAGMIYFGFLESVGGLVYMLVWILLPIAVFAVWFIVGGKFTQSGLGLAKSLLLTHTLVLLSAIIILVISFIPLQSDGGAPEWLAVVAAFAVMAFYCPQIISGSLAQLMFPIAQDETTKVITGNVVMNTIMMVVFGLVLYVGLFCLGYYAKSRKPGGKSGGRREESPSPLARR